MHLQRIVVDNGNYKIKAGNSEADGPIKLRNALTKSRDGMIYIGDDYVDGCNDYSRLIQKAPFDQGHLVSWETEKVIWDHFLNSLGVGSNSEPSDYHLTLTETPFHLPQLSINTDQIILEEYGFNSYYRCTPQSLIPWSEKTDKSSSTDFDFQLVIDVGYNCTWIIPVIYQVVHWGAVKKFPVGGALISGLLAELISFRHYDIRDEPILVNTIKEATCFMAGDFKKTLTKKDKYQCEFVLPDFKTTKTGYLKTLHGDLSADLQSLKLSDERFTPVESFYHPEIIFDNIPSNSYLMQNATFKNIIDLIVASIYSCPALARPLLSKNIVIVGGSSKIPGFMDRLKSELVRELPSNWEVNIKNSVHSSEEASWYGGKTLSNDEMIERVKITKQDYFEHGSNWCQKQFGFKNL